MNDGILEYWEKVEVNHFLIVFIPLHPSFHYSIIPLFQLRSEAELSSKDGLQKRDVFKVSPHNSSLNFSVSTVKTPIQRVA